MPALLSFPLAFLALDLCYEKGGGNCSVNCLSLNSLLHILGQRGNTFPTPCSADIYVPYTLSRWLRLQCALNPAQLALPITQRKITNLSLSLSGLRGASSQEAKR